VVRFFTLKDSSPKEIQTELESLYMDEALCLRTVYKWHERFMQGRTELFDDPRPGRPLQNSLADALHAMILEFFTSCKRFCTHFRFVKSTCLSILHDVLHLQKFNLRWIPHSLDDPHKTERVSLSRDLLTVLKKDQRKGFAQVITGDESWFYFDSLHQSI
jgi:histone-lysine N-methyltransferase SETMAR